jgi:hypothetical protein
LRASGEQGNGMCIGSPASYLTRDDSL